MTTTNLTFCEVCSRHQVKVAWAKQDLTYALRRKKPDKAMIIERKAKYQRAKEDQALHEFECMGRAA